MRSPTGLERLAWLTQPGYIAAEALIGIGLGVAYSFRDDTISALGTGCSSVVLEGCSSQPWVMNAVFIGFGGLQTLGAWHLLRHRASRKHQLVGGLWIVAGSFSILVGLFPVDNHPLAHTLVALPVFLAQPLAIVLHARLLPLSPQRATGMALSTISILGAVLFGASLGSEQWGGLAERVAIWPAKLWLAVAAARTVSRDLDGTQAPADLPGESS